MNIQLSRIPELLLAAVVALIVTLPANAQNIYLGDLALSWLKGPVKSVRNLNTGTELRFDRQGRLIEKTVKGKKKLLSVESRDAQNRTLREVERENASAPGLQVTYTYDDRGRVLSRLTTNNGTGKPLLRRIYIYEGDADYPAAYYENTAAAPVPASIKPGDPNTASMAVEARDSKGNPVKTSLGGMVEEIFTIEYYTE